MPPRLSHLAQNLNTETAFTVLAEARALKAKGKDVVELEIGDSPFPSTNHAKLAGIEAIARNITGYCPSLGLPELREAAAAMMGRELVSRSGPRISWSHPALSRLRLILLKFFLSLAMVS